MRIFKRLGHMWLQCRAACANFICSFHFPLIMGRFIRDCMLLKLFETASEKFLSSQSHCAARFSGNGSMNLLILNVSMNESTWLQMFGFSFWENCNRSSFIITLQSNFPQLSIINQNNLIRLFTQLKLNPSWKLSFSKWVPLLCIFNRKLSLSFCI